MAKPGYEDAQIVLKLMDMWPAEESNWIWGGEFTPDPAEFEARHGGDDAAHAKIRGIINWYESIGALYKHGLLNEDLLFDWLAIDAVWDRVKSHALAIREESGNVHMYENFEAMANAQQSWAAARDKAA